MEIPDKKMTFEMLIRASSFGEDRLSYSDTGIST